MPTLSLLSNGLRKVVGAALVLALTAPTPAWALRAEQFRDQSGTTVGLEDALRADHQLTPGQVQTIIPIENPRDVEYDPVRQLLIMTSRHEREFSLWVSARGGAPKPLIQGLGTIIDTTYDEERGILYFLEALPPGHSGPSNFVVWMIGAQRGFSHKFPLEAQFEPGGIAIDPITHELYITFAQKAPQIILGSRPAHTAERVLGLVQAFQVRMGERPEDFAMTIDQPPIPTGFHKPNDIAINPDRHELYVLEREKQNVLVFDSKTRRERSIMTITGLDRPERILFNREQHLLVVTERQAGRARFFERRGGEHAVFEEVLPPLSDLQVPRGIALASGVLLVAEDGANRVAGYSLTERKPAVIPVTGGLEEEVDLQGIPELERLQSRPGAPVMLITIPVRQPVVDALAELPVGVYMSTDAAEPIMQDRARYRRIIEAVNPEILFTFVNDPIGADILDTRVTPRLRWIVHMGAGFNNVLNDTSRPILTRRKIGVTYIGPSVVPGPTVASVPAAEAPESPLRRTVAEFNEALLLAGWFRLTERVTMESGPGDSPRLLPALEQAAKTRPDVVAHLLWAQFLRQVKQLDAASQLVAEGKFRGAGNGRAGSVVSHQLAPDSDASPRGTIALLGDLDVVRLLRAIATAHGLEVVQPRHAVMARYLILAPGSRGFRAAPLEKRDAAGAPYRWIVDARTLRLSPRIPRQERAAAMKALLAEPLTGKTLAVAGATGSIGSYLTQIMQPFKMAVVTLQRGGDLEVFWRAGDLFAFPVRLSERGPDRTAGMLSPDRLDLLTPGRKVISNIARGQLVSDEVAWVKAIRQHPDLVYVSDVTRDEFAAEQPLRQLGPQGLLTAHTSSNGRQVLNPLGVRDRMALTVVRDNLTEVLRGLAGDRTARPRNLLFLPPGQGGLEEDQRQQEVLRLLTDLQDTASPRRLPIELFSVRNVTIMLTKAYRNWSLGTLQIYQKAQSDDQDVVALVASDSSTGQMYAAIVFLVSERAVTIVNTGEVLAVPEPHNRHGHRYVRLLGTQAFGEFDASVPRMFERRDLEPSGRVSLGHVAIGVRSDTPLVIVRPARHQPAAVGRENNVVLLIDPDSPALDELARRGGAVDGTFYRTLRESARFWVAKTPAPLSTPAFELTMAWRQDDAERSIAIWVKDHGRQRPSFVNLGTIVHDPVLQRALGIPPSLTRLFVEPGTDSVVADTGVKPYHLLRVTTPTGKTRQVVVRADDEVMSVLGDYDVVVAGDDHRGVEPVSWLHRRPLRPWPLFPVPSVLRHPPSLVDAISVGMKIRHAQFGEGVVVSEPERQMSASGLVTVARILFNNRVGITQVVLEYAPIEVVPSPRARAELTSGGLEETATQFRQAQEGFVREIGEARAAPVTTAQVIDLRTMTLEQRHDTLRVLQHLHPVLGAHILLFGTSEIGDALRDDLQQLQLLHNIFFLVEPSVIGTQLRLLGTPRVVYYGTDERLREQLQRIVGDSVSIQQAVLDDLAVFFQRLIASMRGVPMEELLAGEQERARQWGALAQNL